MTRPRRGIGTTIVVVAVVIVVVVATMAFAVLSLQTSTPPHGTQSVASSASSSTSSPSSASTDSALVEQCTETSPGSGFGTVTAGTASPALVCVQLYYFSGTPLNVNLTGALSIQALQYTYNGSVGTPRSFSGASNFTVSVSQSQVTIGGPTNENEGTIIAYAVTAKTGASGTYQLGYLPSSSLDTWMLGAQEPEQCGYYGQLVAGNGQPNYVQPAGCITYTTTNESNSTAASSSSGTTIPGIPYQLVSGDLYFRVVGTASSQSATSSRTTAETGCMVTITTTFVNVTTTQTATEAIACAASSAGISVSGLSLCPANCNYPSPYLSGQVDISGPTPVKLDVYVNGTFDGSSTLNPTALPPGCFVNGTQTTCSTGTVATASTLTSFAYMYKGSIPNAFIPAVVGDRYVVTFVATFEDGSSAIASAVLVATA